MDINIHFDSKAVENKLDRLNSKVSNLGPLLDNIGDVLISHYKNIMEPDPRGVQHSKGGSSEGRAYLYGGMKDSVSVIAMDDSMVSVGPTVQYAANVNAGIPVLPVKTLKKDTPGYVEYAWNEGGAKDAALGLIMQYYDTLLE